tara:strand:+ start:210 stop:725 length:516 start_codon:yes stop_codon:yes gene_type:complete
MRLFGLITTSIILASCSTEVEVKNVDCNQHSEIIKSKEAAFNESGYDADLMQDLIVSYANYANFCREDSLSPEYLMRRADLLRGSGKIRQAITQFKDVHDGYPSYQNKITCAFIAAFLYETELNDREMAEKLYLQIIESYPESHEASVARVSLRHLHETSDELISRLKQNE